MDFWILNRKVHLRLKSWNLSSFHPSEQKASFIDVDIDSMPTIEQISSLLKMVDCDKKKELISSFLYELYVVYRNLYFTYMEINPLVIKDGKVFVLDLAAKIDQVLISRQKMKNK